MSNTGWERLGIVCSHCHEPFELPMTDLPAVPAAFTAQCTFCLHTDDYQKSAVGLLLGAEELEPKGSRWFFWRRRPT